ncbi:hypothetical protein D044_2507A, partial [Vibrio parahaemolyticus EKP-026]
METRQ